MDSCESCPGWSCREGCIIVLIRDDNRGRRQEHIAISSTWPCHNDASNSRIPCQLSAFTYPPACTPHTQAPRTDVHYPASQPHREAGSHSTSRKHNRSIEKPLPAHPFSASTALLVTSSPTHSVSTLASSTSSNFPKLPICGFAVSPGRNWPVPTVLQQHSV